MERVNTMIKDFLLSGILIKNEDSADTLINSIRTVIDNHEQIIQAAVEEYRVTEDREALFISLLPIRNQIFYTAYAQYWLRHCHQIEDPDFTYYNDLIDMYWDWRHQLWRKKEGMYVTVMLPPTMGLILFAYQESADMDRQRSGLKQHMLQVITTQK